MFVFLLTDWFVSTKKIDEMRCKLESTENPRWFENYPTPPHANRRTKFAPVKSLRFSELFLGILLFEFRFTVFFPLGCGVDS